ncbi:VOC family protein [Longimycelium tulufanense]|nr:VOC family protein [Longimycelium tulufanense]
MPCHILYVFLDTSDLERKRRLLEECFGFVPVEWEPKLPHERHGVVKYDAGRVIMSLNLGERPPVPPGYHALTTVLASADPGELRGRLSHGGYPVMPEPSSTVVDDDGHLFEIDGADAHSDGVRSPTGAVNPVASLRLMVADLHRSVEFYCGRIGLAPVQVTRERALVHADNLDLELLAHDSRQVSRRGFLIVFHTPDIVGTCEELAESGVAFRSAIGVSVIGSTRRFADPDGNQLCLYQPSDTSFGWGAGTTMRKIIGGA